MPNYFGYARYGHFAYAKSLEARVNLDIEATTEIRDVFFFSELAIIHSMAALSILPQERRTATIQLKRQPANIQLLLAKADVEVLTRDADSSVSISPGSHEEFVYAD